MNAAHQSHAQCPEEDQLTQVLRGKRDIRDLTRNGRAVGNRDADIRLGECRGVVDTVADHDDLAARLMFLPHKLCFGSR